MAESPTNAHDIVFVSGFSIMHLCFFPWTVSSWGYVEGACHPTGFEGFTLETVSGEELAEPTMPTYLRETCITRVSWTPTRTKVKEFRDQDGRHE